MAFADPHIWEYDTLSSEERWNESFDVVLANPPFMSPKGGIRPHKKFTISSRIVQRGFVCRLYRRALKSQRACRHYCSRGCNFSKRYSLQRPAQNAGR
jgi:hypothetical protein